MTEHMSKTRIPPPRARVLCIDDDPLVLRFYEALFAKHGYQTLTATDGLVGIQLAGDAGPDVIVLDVMLRGLSGYDICRRLRAEPKLREIPIILVTVWEDPSVATTGRAAGATLVLHKTADAQRIVNAIAEMVHRPPAPRE